LLGTATALHAMIGTPQPIPERVASEQAVARARAALGEEAWQAAFAAGGELSAEDAIAYAMQT